MIQKKISILKGEREVMSGTDSIQPTPQPEKPSFQAVAEQKASAETLEQLVAIIKLNNQKDNLEQILSMAKAAQVTQEVAAPTKAASATPSGDPAGLIQTELKYYKQLIDTFSDYVGLSSPLTAKIAKWQGSLDTISASYQANQDNLSPSMIKQLEQIFQDMNHTASSEMLLADPTAYREYIKKEIEMFQNLEGQTTQSNTVNTALKKAQSSLWNKYNASDSLPNQFAKAILNKFMPKQEKFLRYLAEMLEIGNYGAGIFNEILDGISDFADANNNYTLNNWLGNRTTGKANVYNGTASAANNQIDKEKNQAIADKNRATQEQKDIEGKMGDIKNKEAELYKEYKDGQISLTKYQALKGQYDSMLSQLSVLDANLTQAIRTLTLHIELLKQLKAVPDKDDPDHKFDMQPGNAGETWKTELEEGENYIINGDPTSKPPGLGGLLNINSLASTDQTKWGSQSQQDQMQLQLTMTVIQQEWTIVSTSMQLLNQMYMTTAQSVYK